MNPIQILKIRVKIQFKSWFCSSTGRIILLEGLPIAPIIESQELKLKITYQVAIMVGTRVVEQYSIRSN